MSKVTDVIIEIETEATVEEAIEQPTEILTEQPAERPVEQLVDQLAEQSVEPPMEQPMEVPSEGGTVSLGFLVEKLSIGPEIRHREGQYQQWEQSGGWAYVGLQPSKEWRVSIDVPSEIVEKPEGVVFVIRNLFEQLLGGLTTAVIETGGKDVQVAERTSDYTRGF